MSNTYKSFVLSAGQVLSGGLSVNRVLSVDVVPIFDLSLVVPNGITDESNNYITDENGNVITS